MEENNAAKDSTDIISEERIRLMKAYMVALRKGWEAFPGSAAWHTMNNAEKALRAYDQDHPEEAQAAREMNGGALEYE